MATRRLDTARSSSGPSVELQRRDHRVRETDGGRRTELRPLQQPENPNVRPKEIGRRLRDPWENLVHVTERRDGPGQTTQDQEGVLLVGEAGLRQDVLQCGGELREVALPFDDVVGGAELEGLDGRPLVPLPGHDHHRDPDLLLPERLEDLDPREVGHLVVQDEEVVRGGPEALDGFAPPRGDLELEVGAVLSEGPARELDIGGIVLGVEHADRRSP